MGPATRAAVARAAACMRKVEADPTLRSALSRIGARGCDAVASFIIDTVDAAAASRPMAAELAFHAGDADANARSAAAHPECR